MTKGLSLAKRPLTQPPLLVAPQDFQALRQLKASVDDRSRWAKSKAPGSEGSGGFSLDGSTWGWGWGVEPSQTSHPFLGGWMARLVWKHLDHQGPEKFDSDQMGEKAAVGLVYQALDFVIGVSDLSCRFETITVAALTSLGIPLPKRAARALRFPPAHIPNLRAHPPSPTSDLFGCMIQI